jgi:type I restriction enzyme S subunit
MSHYKPYPAYKDSGVEWIGRVPEGWRVAPIKVLAQVINGATPESGNPYYWDGDIAWFTPADLDNENATDLVEPRRKITAHGLASCAARLTPSGSVVLSTRAPVGSVGVTQTPSATNQGCRTLVPAEGIPSKFLAETLVAARAELARRSNGTTFQELSTDSLASLRVPLPPHAEQTAIAAAIDRETARIDALISRKTRFIELLKEKRQALITHAVTKGLDPNVKMKDSGVEWIGDVPEGWSVGILKRFVVFQRGHDLPSESRVDGSVPVVSSGGHSGTHNLAIAKAPGIVTGRYGSLGVFTFVQEDYWPLNTALYSIDFYNNAPRFIWYLLQNISSLFLLYSAKAAVPGIDRNDIHEILVAAPAHDEQEQIARHLDKQIDRLNAIKAKTELSIDLLKERRSAFITSAVTGQIDLRDEA